MAGGCLCFSWADWLRPLKAAVAVFCGGGRAAAVVEWPMMGVIATSVSCGVASSAAVLPEDVSESEVEEMSGSESAVNLQKVCLLFPAKRGTRRN